MIDAIRLGDTTDHGGAVVTGSMTMKLRGRPVARKGDELICPLHPEIQPNLIIEGDVRITDRGVPVARHGDLGTCGCHLISTLV